MKKLLTVSILALLTVTQYVDAAGAGGAGAGAEAGTAADGSPGGSSRRSRSPFRYAGGAWAGEGAGAETGAGAGLTRERSSSRSRSPYGAAGGAGAGAGAAVASTSSGDELSTNMQEFGGSLWPTKEGRAWGRRLIDSVKASAERAGPGEPINFPMEVFGPHDEVVTMDKFAKEYPLRPLSSLYNTAVYVPMEDIIKALTDRDLASTNVDTTLVFHNLGYTFTVRIKFRPADFVADPASITMQLRHALEKFPTPLNFRKRGSIVGGDYKLTLPEFYFSDSADGRPAPAAGEPYLMSIGYVSPIMASSCRHTAAERHPLGRSCRLSALSLTLEVQKSS